MNGIKHVADPDPFPSGLGSGSGSGPVGYSKEHNKMLQSNFWLVPIRSSDMETQVKIFEKKLFWYIIILKRRGSGSLQNSQIRIKVKIPDPDQNGSATLMLKYINCRYRHGTYTCMRSSRCI